MIIDADRDEDDTEIYLSVKGENSRTLLISAMENSSDNRVIQNIQLEQNLLWNFFAEQDVAF